MPELPEVDLVARTLDALITGRRIRTAKLLRQRLAPDSTPAVFARRLKGAAIRGVTRRGKHILIGLDNDRTLLVHLRMSGRFSLLDPEDSERKYTHAILYFEDGTRLSFDDQRHFGFMKIVAAGELETSAAIAKLAAEPFSDEFSPESLYASLRRSARTLKEFLLDQTKVTGLGNIYAAEAMFAAGIDPRVRANKLSAPKARRLYDAIIAVLTEQIEMSKAGEIDRKNIDGRYSVPDRDRGWLVYGREGEPCVNCNSLIVRLKQGGRSTYYCKTCQRR